MFLVHVFPAVGWCPEKSQTFTPCEAKDFKSLIVRLKIRGKADPFVDCGDHVPLSDSPS